MDDIQDRIAWNSALNNAVNMVAAGIACPTVEVGLSFSSKAHIEGWQAYFYKNLTQRKKPEPTKQVDHATAREKGRDDADHDAGLADTIQ